MYLSGDGQSFPYTNAAKDISVRQAQRAAERGHVCVYPLRSELFLDIDSLEGLGRLFAALSQNTYMKSIVLGAPLVKSSPSGKAGRFHVIVFLKKDVDKFERITLQALLGSDLAREILSYQEAQAAVPPTFAPVPNLDDDLPARERTPAILGGPSPRERAPGSIGRGSDY